MGTVLLSTVAAAARHQWAAWNSRPGWVNVPVLSKQKTRVLPAMAIRLTYTATATQSPFSCSTLYAIVCWRANQNILEIMLSPKGASLMLQNSISDCQVTDTRWWNKWIRPCRRSRHHAGASRHFVRLSTGRLAAAATASVML